MLETLYRAHLFSRWDSCESKWKFVIKIIALRAWSLLHFEFDLGHFAICQSREEPGIYDLFMIRIKEVLYERK